MPQGKLYMCGHSLGPMPLAAQRMVVQALSDWGGLAIESWNKSHWIDLSTHLGAKIAVLVGAKGDEVVVCDSTTINLYKLIKCVMRFRGPAKIILTVEDDFPADMYVLQGLRDFDGAELRVVQSSEIIKAIDPGVAAIVLSHTNYRNASVLEMKRICDCAKRFGVITIWDLSHSVGIVPIDLSLCGADFAVGCTYKYLNGGPGSPAFIYANSKYQEHLCSPIYGWMGHDNPFAFSPSYASYGVKAFLGGTPYVLSMKSLEAALTLLSAELIVGLYDKAQEYSLLLINGLSSLGLNPLLVEVRGGHVAFVHRDAYGISRALVDSGVVCDYRHPDLIRFCVNPMYLDECDINQCLSVAQKVIDDGLYFDVKYKKMLKVT